MTNFISRLPRELLSQIFDCYRTWQLLRLASRAHYVSLKNYYEAHNIKFADLTSDEELLYYKFVDMILNVIYHDHTNGPTTTRQFHIITNNERYNVISLRTIHAGYKNSSSYGCFMAFYDCDGRPICYLRRERPYDSENSDYLMINGKNYRILSEMGSAVKSRHISKYFYENIPELHRITR